MGKRLDRFHRFQALAKEPSWQLRLAVGMGVGIAVFLLIYLSWIQLAEVGGWPLLIFAGVPACGAFAFASAQTSIGRAILFGALGGIWLFAEVILAAIGTALSVLG
jgi:hypothetical protein